MFILKLRYTTQEKLVAIQQFNTAFDLNRDAPLIIIDRLERNVTQKNRQKTHKRPLSNRSKYLLERTIKVFEMQTLTRGRVTRVFLTQLSFFPASRKLETVKTWTR